MSSETTVSELIQKLFDEEVEIDHERFSQPGWYYQGQAPLLCSDCESELEIFRKPYSTSKGEYEYWAIFCRGCAECSELDDFDSTAQKAFREWSKEEIVTLPKKIQLNSVKPASTFKPTSEQEAILEAILDDSDLSIEALAGTGKTTTLRLLGEQLSDRNGVYVAFNKSIVDEAKSKFPTNVHCTTAHSLAYRDVGYKYKMRINSTQRMSNEQIGKWLDAKKFAYKSRIANHVLEPSQIAIQANNTVRNFCKSLENEIESKHVEISPLLATNEQAVEAFQKLVVPHARKIWNDLQKTDGFMKFSHDHYLKLWQLSSPKLPFEFILFDESQDADPVMLSVVNDQANALLVYCGDKNQAIYEWRGAVNALDKVHVDKKLWLTQSFRFGLKIAEEANYFLEKLSAEHTVEGLRSISSTVQADSNPDAVLCRTNGGVIRALMSSLDQKKKVAIIGRSDNLIEFARACDDLKRGVRTAHPELAPFLTWDDVKHWIESDPAETGQIKTMVDLVDTYGAPRLIACLKQTVDERSADIVLSTAHRAKGREWDSVKVTSDFIDRKVMRPEDYRLAYVAVTRAMKNLDISEWDNVEDSSELSGLIPTQNKINKTRPPITS
jgi:superfamily I DNA/RNA helicase